MFSKDGKPQRCMMLEDLSGGTLHPYFKRKLFWRRKSTFKYGEVLTMSLALANGLSYLHDGCSPDFRIIHRDLNPRNICFAASGVLKIIDFDVSIMVLKSRRYADAVTGLLHDF
jgi:serine/threonine protein kinase